MALMFVEANLFEHYIYIYIYMFVFTSVPHKYQKIILEEGADFIHPLLYTVYYTHSSCRTRRQHMRRHSLRERCQRKRAALDRSYEHF